MTARTTSTRQGFQPAEGPGDDPEAQAPHPHVVLSFDVEEHDRIEAAAGLTIDPALKGQYRDRLASSTSWLLDELGGRGIKATFFVVGQIAEYNPAVVRSIHRAGHEVASHGWDHRRLHEMTAASFRRDVRQAKDALEQVTGAAVVGYRAPTFSIVRRTAWAIDVLAELGVLYDSSIYPVRHDRYGIPDAPRTPFLALGSNRAILEIPPATLRVLGANIPVGGGGYFRLLPLAAMGCAVRQIRRACSPPVVMLYFHPWEFDPEQPRLPLRRLNRFRTYVGINRARGRLSELLTRHRFGRAVDVLEWLDPADDALPRFRPAAVR
jgi:polysaccharide deacetylase family protein (PEP-CTERM system associated)